MFKDWIWGATEPESLLPKSFPRESPSSDVDGLLNSLRHTELPVLLENSLNDEVTEISEKMCRKNLWTNGMQPTMMPIAISAKLVQCQLSRKRSLWMSTHAQSPSLSIVS